LGLETVLNFVLDIYRPRTPGVEPRACFDSRILGLISEPGGIAHTVAEAINYQFGFQVSQTWFYQLLQRAAVPLAAAGAVALWLMSSVVVVQPYERGIVERFGAQLNADSPLGPGLHFKWPWPIARVSKFNTEQLHQIVIGHKLDLDEAEKDVHEEEELGVEQWTDEQHAGHEHHEFIVAPPASLAAEGATRRSASARGAPVHLLRMKVVVQYRIMETRLGEYSRQAADAHRLLRDLSWQEVLRFNAGSDVASLLGELRSRAGGMLAERIRKRCDDLGLGLEIVYVGLLGVHPNQSVAKEYRQVIGAEQEKIAKIQQARDKENEILSRVAGDKQTALALAEATKKTQENESAFNAAEQELQARQPPVTQDLLDQADALGAVLTSRIEARWRLDQANTTLQNIKKDAAWGIGHSERDIKDAEQAVQQARAGWAAADRAFELAATPLRIELGKQLDESTIATVLRRAEARFALDFWNARVEGLIPDLRGAAAVVLAEAQARRWEVEMQAAGEVARLEADRHAYAVAPRVYRARRYLQVLAGGLSNARKYFLAFDPGEREVRLILDAQEEVRPEDLAVPTGQP
jgi:regulator of protease activity HflC (stomatin/prohibitin superfamily)